MSACLQKGPTVQEPGTSIFVQSVFKFLQLASTWMYRWTIITLDVQVDYHHLGCTGGLSSPWMYRWTIITLDVQVDYHHLGCTGGLSSPFNTDHKPLLNHKGRRKRSTTVGCVPYAHFSGHLRGCLPLVLGGVCLWSWVVSALVCARFAKFCKILVSARFSGVCVW